MAHRLLLRTLLLGLLLGLGIKPASAHPHVWIDTQLQAQFDPQGAVTSLRLIWRFDDLYSQASIEGRDSNGDGVYSRQELQPLIAMAMDNLEEWFYFADIRQNGERIVALHPTVFEARMDGGQLIYDFTLPLPKPVSLANGALRVRQFDPSIYIGIDLQKKAPVTLLDAPAGCKAGIIPAPGLQETFLMSEQAFTASDPEPGSEGVGGAFAETVRIACGA
jgi:ABC-type uncharacterized transport system substrate-binding protein